MLPDPVLNSCYNCWVFGLLLQCGNVLQLGFLCAAVNQLLLPLAPLSQAGVISGADLECPGFSCTVCLCEGKWENQPGAQQNHGNALAWKSPSKSSSGAMKSAGRASSSPHFTPLLSNGKSPKWEQFGSVTPPLGTRASSTC